jgi:tetratricopeptide (TPR) repeat protein
VTLRPITTPALLAIVTVGAGMASLACSKRALDVCEADALADNKVGSKVVPARKCLERFLQSGDEELGLRLATRYHAADKAAEVQQIAEKLLTSAQSTRGLDGTASILYERGDYAKAGALWDRELLLAQKSGRHREAAEAAYGQYMVALNQSSARRALVALELVRHEASSTHDRTLLWRAAMGSFEVLFDMGALPAAREALEKGKALADRDQPNEWKQVVFREGLLDLEEGRYLLAQKSFAAAKALNQKSTPADTRLGWYIALNELETDFKALDIEHGRASLKFAEDLQRRKQAPDNVHAQVALLHHRARLRQMEKRYSEALEDVDVALAKLPNAEWLWQLWSFKGELLQASNQRKLAAAAYRAATDIIVELAAKTENDDLKASVLANKRLPFTRLTELQLDASDPLGALETLERSRSRSFFEAFVPRPVTTAMPVPLEVSLERVDLIEQVLPKLRAVNASTERSMENVVEQLSRRHLLIYAETDSRLFIIEISKGHVRTHVRPIDSRQLARLVAEFVLAPERRELAMRLGELLVPAAIELRGEVLQIVPGAMLSTVPFAALLRSGRLLVEQCAPAEIPNLSWLVRAAGLAAARGEAAVVLGDPAGDLPGSEREAKVVAKLLSVQATTGSEANAAALQRSMGAAVLHVSGHAGMDSAGPWLGLAQSQARIADILAIKPAPKVVVLSNCASAATTDPGLWGSLAAAFLATGSHAVIASLRSISDGNTPEFMSDFYRLGGARDPIAALARTQRTWAKKVSPVVWASFVALGGD